MNTKKIQYLTVCGFFLSAVALMGCTNEVELIDNGKTESLSIRPTVANAKVTRANTVEDVTALNEDKVEKLDVLVFGENNSTACKLQKTFTSPTEGEENELASGKWKTTYSLTENTAYPVYSIANAGNFKDANGTALSFSSSTTTDGLTNLTVVDDDICKPYSSSDNSNKTFLMDNNVNYTITSEATQTIKEGVNLKRAAAKIQVDLTVNVTGYTPGTISWELKNYYTKTSVLDGTSVPAPEVNYLKSMDNYSSVTTTGSNNQTVITTYSYSFDWSNAESSAPYLLVKIPFTKNGESSGQDYYYRIPVTDKTQFDRNTIYRVTADLQTLGSTSELLPEVVSQNLKYNVYPWTVDETKINAGDSHYLMVEPCDPEIVYMRNVSTTGNDIKFYSSSDINVTVNEVYYYDKDGNKKIISSSSEQYPTFTYTGTSGTLEMNASVPTNLTVKFIKFTVKNTEDDSKTVTVKQYPREYIQNLYGWYSSRTTEGWKKWKNEYDGMVVNSWKASGFEGSSMYDYNYKGGYGYYAKYYQNGIKFFSDNKSQTLNNNRMYVVQITNTDGTYNIGHVTKKDDGTSDDNVVSPAFMLASQLGFVYSNGFADDYQGSGWGTSKVEGSGNKKARTHCETYKEVSKDQKTNEIKIYTGWRLPTKAEILIIADRQNNYPEALSEVLNTGDYYYTLDGDKQVTKSSRNPSGPFVRCVRDLTPSEVAELEAKKE